jgi:hypothetical protein
MKKWFSVLVVLLVVVSGKAQQANNLSITGNGKSAFKYTKPITRDTTISMRDHCI